MTYLSILSKPIAFSSYGVLDCTVYSMFVRQTANGPHDIGQSCDQWNCSNSLRLSTITLLLLINSIELDILACVRRYYWVEEA